MLFLSDEFIKKLKEFEGVRLEAYEDAAGIWTIGYGHTHDVRRGDKISEYCAEEYDSERTAEQQREVLDHIEEMKEYNKGLPAEEKIDDPLLRGKGESLGGDVQFSMDDTDKLPPLHPNCRCTAMFNYD